MQIQYKIKIPTIPAMKGQCYEIPTLGLYPPISIQYNIINIGIDVV